MRRPGRKKALAQKRKQMISKLKSWIGKILVCKIQKRQSADNDSGGVQTSPVVTGGHLNV